MLDWIIFMFKRILEDSLGEYLKLPVLAILGPRQSGKTTLAKKVFSNYKYLSFEDPATRFLAEQDPRLFFRQYENQYGIILDEFQNVPGILSYIQLEVDEKDRPGYFVLTGSQNFLMNEAITQSLAGRVGIVTLLPLALQEFRDNAIPLTTPDQAVLAGCYPRLYDKNVAPSVLYPSYIHSYIERDVRQLINVRNFKTFYMFLQLCAGRIGQVLNLAEIAGLCAISASTAQEWLSVLEASYIVFTLSPFRKNFQKRLTKKQKLYFYDTGIACALLGIKTEAELLVNPLRGMLFECFIIADCHKQFYNAGSDPSIYFWRDQNGRLEVDCIVQKAHKLIPIEIKAADTIRQDFFDGLVDWCFLAKMGEEGNVVVYGGNDKQVCKHGTIMSWKNAGSLVSDNHS